MSHDPTPEEADKAINDLLEGNFRIDTLRVDQVYKRLHDDNDGATGVNNALQVYIAEDSDVHVFLPNSLESLRFRSYFGGGKSLRVRNALLILAEAIRRDNDERPQTPIPPAQ